MNFPKRTKQHKFQSDSFAILLYKLKDLGIFRNATENDYGIDFEIEIVHDDRVIGKYLKAQVKSAEEIYIKSNSIPTVGGIKQSTLLYWIEVSYRVHVVAFAVDLKTETIYVSRPLFWQATCLLDNSESTKTIEFLPLVKSEDEEKQDKTFQVKLQQFILKMYAFDYTVTEIIIAHKTIIRNLKNIFELYTDLWHYDYHCEVFSIDTFKTFLDYSQMLIGIIPEDIKFENENDKRNIYNFQYWAKKTGWGGDEVQNYIAQTPLKILLPLLLDRLSYYNSIVLKGKYYWLRKDMPYLKMVFNTNIPTERSHDSLIRVDYDKFTFYEEKFDYYDFIKD